MSFFDRFKKKPASDPPVDPWSQLPTADTMCLVLMDRVLEEIEPAAPLWVWVYGDYQEKTPIIRTAGSQDFGLPELGFYNPTKLEVKELLDFLYAMSCLQITGRQLYRNAALVPLNEEIEVVCKRNGDVLFFFGA